MYKFENNTLSSPMKQAIKTETHQVYYQVVLMTHDLDTKPCGHKHRSLIAAINCKERLTKSDFVKSGFTESVWEWK